ncbi:MAG: hypothetical protein NC453_25815 [Muribaculum sp.]|nr:hypothetical protein [Muribaculum sp.]
MITKLEGLTAAQFIDLVCGDTSVLLSKHEIVSPGKVAIVTRNIVCEYHCLTNEAAFKRHLSRIVDMITIKTEIVLYSICNALIAVKEYPSAREILKSAGINAERMSDQRLTAEVKSRYQRAKLKAEKLETDEVKTMEAADIRKSFDEQTAAMMAHYKFQINTSTMKATLYAHLVARFNREVKVQMEALKKK